MPAAAAVATVATAAIGASAQAKAAKKSANAITQDSSADATGTASFFRLYKSDGTTCVLQGTVGTSGTTQTTVKFDFKPRPIRKAPKTADGKVAMTAHHH